MTGGLLCRGRQRKQSGLNWPHNQTATRHIMMQSYALMIAAQNEKSSSFAALTRPIRARRPGALMRLVKALLKTA